VDGRLGCTLALVLHPCSTDYINLYQPLQYHPNAQPQPNPRPRPPTPSPLHPDRDRQPGQQGRVPRVQPVHGAVFRQPARRHRHQGGQEAGAGGEDAERAQPQVRAALRWALVVGRGGAGGGAGGGLGALGWVFNGMAWAFVGDEGSNSATRNAKLAPRPRPPPLLCLHVLAHSSHTPRRTS